MKIKRISDILNEGTWTSPKSKEQAQEYIDKLKKFKDEVYDVFGDDEVFNGLDAAETRMNEILKEMK